MLNYLWAAMLILGIVYGTLQGRLPELTEAALTSAGEAVNLCVTMAGIMALWVGVMEIAQKSGIIGRVSRVIGPFLDFMFPRLPREHPAREYITTNVIANIFGLGWAATPAGLKAMEALSDLEEERRRMGQQARKKGTASNEMCTFLVLNIASLQLIPVNIIAYRSQYGSVNPAAILAPSLVATLISAVVAVVFCKLMDRG
ncbi:MAG: nucleoside recognition protein [Anaerosacchariphilus sp.]